MQLTIASLLLLLAAPAAAQMPTHPPMNQPQNLATGEVPSAARGAVNANLAATRLSPAAKATADARKERAKLSEELQKKKGGK